jgi:hypothetical protein
MPNARLGACLWVVAVNEIENENPIRQDMGYPQRTSYYLPAFY